MPIILFLHLFLSRALRGMAMHNSQTDAPLSSPLPSRYLPLLASDFTFSQSLLPPYFNTTRLTSSITPPPRLTPNLFRPRLLHYPLSGPLLVFSSTLSRHLIPQGNQLTHLEPQLLLEPHVSSRAGHSNNSLE